MLHKVGEAWSDPLLVLISQPEVQACKETPRPFTVVRFRSRIEQPDRSIAQGPDHQSALERRPVLVSEPLQTRVAGIVLERSGRRLCLARQPIQVRLAAAKPADFLNWQNVVDEVASLPPSIGNTIEGSQ